MSSFLDINLCIRNAVERRRPLMDSGVTDAYRLFHGAADGVEGLVVERYADVLVVQIHEGKLEGDVDRLVPALDALRAELGARAVYRKRFVPDRAAASPDVARLHGQAEPWIGEPVEPARTVTEHGLRFVIRPYDGFSVGLFLEHRDTRRRVRELAAGRRVLNAFSYTGGFSVAAVAGGAASVSSVDVSRRYLEWSKENFAANGLDLAGHWFFCSDVIEFYARARRQGRRFDLVILDPPTFARTRRPKRAFVLAEQIGALIEGALSVLDPGGILVVATNCRQIPFDRLETELRRTAGSRVCRRLERPDLPLDFADDPDYSKTLIAWLD